MGLFNKIKNVLFTEEEETTEIPLIQKDEYKYEEKEDTKEFVIKRPVTLDNPEFEENTVKLENPDFIEKDTNSEENPNFE